VAVDGFASSPSCFSDYAARLVGRDGCGCDYVGLGDIIYCKWWVLAIFVFELIGFFDCFLVFFYI
jgi:hypothetical protein